MGRPRTKGTFRGWDATERFRPGSAGPPGPLGPDVLAAHGESRGRYGARKIKALLARSGKVASRRRICLNSRSSLESIYCDGAFSTTGLSGSLMFANCTRLVGGTDGYVPSTTSSASVCRMGADGALADGHIWANANHNAVGLLPCYGPREQALRAEFAASMAAYSKMNPNYWFYGYHALAGVSGWTNVAVAAMRYTFTARTGLSTLSLEGIGGPGITDLFYTFSGCTALTTIYVDTAFVSSGCFYNCAKLVGGNGTAYANNAHSAAYFRVDEAGTPEYLTAV